MKNLTLEQRGKALDEGKKLQWAVSNVPDDGWKDFDKQDSDDLVNYINPNRYFRIRPQTLEEAASQYAEQRYDKVGLKEKNIAYKAYLLGAQW